MYAIVRTGGHQYRVEQGDEIDVALMDVAEGDQLELELDPHKGWGMPDPSLVHTLALDDFPDRVAATPGHLIEFRMPGGETLPGRVESVCGQNVLVDFNHPLAGHSVRVEITLVGIEQPLEFLGV